MCLKGNSNVFMKPIKHFSALVYLNVEMSCPRSRLIKIFLSPKRESSLIIVSISHYHNITILFARYIKLFVVYYLFLYRIVHTYITHLSFKRNIVFIFKILNHLIYEYLHVSCFKLKNRHNNI